MNVLFLAGGMWIGMRCRIRTGGASSVSACGFRACIRFTPCTDSAVCVKTARMQQMCVDGDAPSVWLKR